MIYRTDTDELSFMLKPSSIDGVGVFAMHGIKKRTHLRLFKGPGTRKVPVKDVEPGSVLYEFLDRYGIKDGPIYWAPHDFCKMDVGWYINHSNTPNSEGDGQEDTEYFALRDIEAGEEITVDYKTLSPDEAVLCKDLR